MEASVLDLRKRMREVMMAIDRHETVTLTHRGKRRAIIIPWGKTKKAKVKVADLSAFGMWCDRPETANPVAYVKSIRKPRFR
jgi:antitoxin (DNA-binding transcriptional repressor) of toxin-antitoxin stability system